MDGLFKMLSLGAYHQCNRPKSFKKKKLLPMAKPTSTLFWSSTIFSSSCRQQTSSSWAASWRHRRDARFFVNNQTKDLFWVFMVLCFLRQNNFFIWNSELVAIVRGFNSLVDYILIMRICLPSECTYLPIRLY